MCAFIDTLKADSVQDLLKQYWLAKAATAYQVFPHLPYLILPKKPTSENPSFSK
ncbi:hypothetical protein [Nostoc sp. WHI]|uniref:hypothetical protein n=1 Tax=Nostoc sp. WHI TaxID=2650611 RepID=UPI0018C6425D|nr:hypothetical protein [Nostoc sp. WHI]